MSNRQGLAGVEEMLFDLILPPKAVGTSCSQSQHFLVPLSKYHFGTGGCPAASVLQGGQAANSDRISVGYVKCLHQPVTGYIFRTQQDAAVLLKCSLTLVLARAEFASGRLMEFSC